MDNSAAEVSVASIGAIPPCLHTEVCPNCAYLLAGLPDAGLCPECGTAYDQSQIILYGWGRGQHENLATAKRSKLIWLFVASTLWIAFQSFQLVGFRFIPRWFFAIIAASILLNIFSLMRRTNVVHPGLIQVRLNERDCVQYKSLDGGGPMGELIAAHIWLVVVCCAIALVVVYWRGSIDSVWFWICFPIIVALSIWLWGDCRRFRIAMSKIPDNAIADRNAAYQRPLLWKDVSDYYFGQGFNGRYHLRIDRKKWILTEYPIDAEICCTTEQADALRQWLKERMAVRKI